MLLINQIKLNINKPVSALGKTVAGLLGIQEKEINSLSVIKRSIDARKKPDIFYIYSVIVNVNNENKILKRCKSNQVSIWDYKAFTLYDDTATKPSRRPIIIGFGPSGIFCAYILAKAGFCPVVFEMGESGADRKKSVENFWLGDKLKTSSNVQFGEGGAGTFSDGKLNTLIKDKDGCMRFVLETFVHFGAKDEILYDAKPHVGTDVLLKIIENLRNEIISLGGEIHFSSKVNNFVIENNTLHKIIVNGKEIEVSDCILACGHSARETFELLHEKNISMHSKPFAVGFRVQHPQTVIDKALYGGSIDKLGPAPYKVTAKTTSGRGAYSFCMCPGGYVVNASSEENMLCINGMSYSDRASGVANSAILVNIDEAYNGNDTLSGMKFQRELESRTYKLANGKIPCQRLGDFKKALNWKSGGSSFDSFEPAFKGDYSFCDISSILPKELNIDILEGFEVFGRSIDGFNDDNAILAAVESRSSSPVKFDRNDNFESSVNGLYPIGEGAGYAGGIVSAAVDGARCAIKIIEKYNHDTE